MKRTSLFAMFAGFAVSSVVNAAIVDPPVECDVSESLRLISAETYATNFGVVLYLELDDANKTTFGVFSDPATAGDMAWELVGITDWYASGVTLDANGNLLTLEDGYGVFISCAEDGGVDVSVQGPDIPQQTFNISATGDVIEIAATQVCGCSSLGTQTADCDVIACNTPIFVCRSGSQGYCQPGTDPN